MNGGWFCYECQVPMERDGPKKYVCPVCSRTLNDDDIGED